MTLSDRPVMISDGMFSFWVDGSPWPAMLTDSKDFYLLVKGCVALDTEVDLKWLRLAEENENSLWNCNLPASPQSQCSNQSIRASSGHFRFHRSQLLGWATLQW